MDEFLSSKTWSDVRLRALERDKHSCTVAALLGGPCRGRLHVHHIQPRAERPDLALALDNLGTSCAAHHAAWEGLRRQLEKMAGVRRCPHQHRSAEARALCERRLSERSVSVAA